MDIDDVNVYIIWHIFFNKSNFLNESNFNKLINH